jgi:hypothetical protein
VGYGPARKGQEYTELASGPDWSLLSVNGKAVYVPLYIFTPQEEPQYD